MSKLQEIIDSHSKLRDYCDDFWKRIFDKFPEEFVCAAGCSTCCELQSVNVLEAFVIADYCCTQNNLSGRTLIPSPLGGACPFLADNRCRIYPVRPLICRTHGLLLKSREFSDRVALSCPFNFATVDHAAIDDADMLDIDAVTTGLAKLNAAFCMLLGDVKKAKERIALSDLASGKTGRSWFAV